MHGLAYEAIENHDVWNEADVRVNLSVMRLNVGLNSHYHK
jgi:hypothetical protein